ncbi:Pre-small/secreted glycoprotein [Trichinella pseudospiralis]
MEFYKLKESRVMLPLYTERTAYQRRSPVAEAVPTALNVLHMQLSCGCIDVPKMEGGWHFRAAVPPPWPNFTSWRKECPLMKSALSRSCQTSATASF